MKKIILASTSPRRNELMSSLGLAFDVVSPDYDEKMAGLKFSYEAIESIALNKGKSAKQKVTTSALIISADTVVVLGLDVLGKPKDASDAKKMLSALSDNSHKVVTSIAIIDTETDKTIVQSTTSNVRFNKLSECDIDYYIKKFKPFDKAGSYGIQELPDGFVKEIDGDFDNIVGLPTKTLIKMLADINNCAHL